MTNGERLYLGYSETEYYLIVSEKNLENVQQYCIQKGFSITEGPMEYFHDEELPLSLKNSFWFLIKTDAPISSIPNVIYLNYLYFDLNNPKRLFGRSNLVSVYSPNGFTQEDKLKLKEKSIEYKLELIDLFNDNKTLELACTSSSIGNCVSVSNLMNNIMPKFSFSPCFDTTILF